MAIKFDTYLVDGTPTIGDEEFKERCGALIENRLTESRVVIASDRWSVLRPYCDVGVVLWNGHVEFFPNLEDAWDYHEQLIEQLPNGRSGRDYDR